MKAPKPPGIRSSSVFSLESRCLLWRWSGWISRLFFPSLCYSHQGIFLRSLPWKPGVARGSKAKAWPPAPSRLVSRAFSLSCRFTCSLQELKLLFKCFHQLVASGASAPGKHILDAVSLWLCLFLQILGSWFAFQHHFSDETKKSLWFLVCWTSKDGWDDGFQALYLSDLRQENL